MAEVADAIAQENENSTGIFLLLQRGLGTLEHDAGQDPDASADLLAAFLLKAADVLGAAPSFGAVPDAGGLPNLARRSGSPTRQVVRCAPRAPRRAPISSGTAWCLAWRRWQRRIFVLFPISKRPWWAIASAWPGVSSNTISTVVSRASRYSVTDMPLDLSKLDRDRIPAHVGIIMDGNGRWAQARGLERTQGHAAGEAALFDAVEGALQIGLGWLTAYTFSTENWNRPADEVEFLMFFNEDLLIRRRDELHIQGVRMHFAGLLDDPRIPDQNKVRMADAEELTKNNENLNLVFAFNYGGRAELVRAAQRLAAAARDGHLDPDAIDEERLSRELGVPGMPDCDLVIRTSGEQRISNFLLWQAAYAELMFPEILWPDFGAQSLVDYVVEFQQRTRRFGTVG